MPPAKIVSTRPGRRTARSRFSTRRRLIAAFGIVLVVFHVALAILLSGLRRMEATFAEMHDHEEQMVLALRLEDAERERYAHALRFVRGEVDDFEEYDQTHALSERLAQTLTARMDEPDAIAWLGDIRHAGAELDRMLREAVMPTTAARHAAAVATLERSYPLVALIDRDIDLIITRLQQSSSHCREVLAILERRAARFTAVLLLLAPVLIAMLVLYLSRSVARPLARIGEGAAAIASGDLTTRIDVETPDEFGTLAADFNAMTVALEHNQRKLVESEKLAGIGRLAAGIAHELNNPLQVMLGYLSLHRDVADRRLAGHLAAVEVETLRCRDIIDDLGQLSRPAVGVVDVDLRSMCEAVTERVCAAVRPEAPRISVQGTALAHADPQRLGQVLFNLVKNAAEAAGPDGAVTVGIGTSGRTVEVAVGDSGPGIACQARGRLFEPFFTTKPCGTGLGLAVSRAIARAHGGDIDVRNGESRGAVFTLRLPRSPQPGDET